MKEEKIIKEITQIATRLQHMHYDINEVKMIVKEQNGRVRKNETAIARINGIGSIFIVIFSGLLSYFKLK
jgi:hypothetical protein